ncbi:MAG: DUF2147 domain-containing protein [Bacteroidia bacterium]
MKKIILVIFALVSILFSANAQQNADDIVGVWLTGSGKAHVKIDKVGNYYFGRIVWLKEPLNPEGKPKVDKNNEDISKRTKPLMGMQLVGGFEWKNDNLWDNGNIYDPENGKTYKCKIDLENSTSMNIRGYIGISLFGRTDIWKKVK